LRTTDEAVEGGAAGDGIKPGDDGARGEENRLADSVDLSMAKRWR
jgi:hypothetical protein